MSVRFGIRAGRINYIRPWLSAFLDWSPGPLEPTGTPGNLRSLKQAGLPALLRLEFELAVAELGGDAALRRALEIAFHNQVGLINLLERVGLLAHGDRQRADAHRSAAEFDDHRLENALV